jgi:nucleoid DNA-binding protein
MTKLDITQEIIKQTGAPKKISEIAVEEILFEIKYALSRGESVNLKKFGKFDVRKKKARMGRNPRTGEAAKISARKVVLFKSGKFIRSAVNS